jgi:predicted amidohydrolase
MASQTKPRFVRAAAAQLAPSLGDLATNRAQAAAAIVEGAARGASIVVLPELCVSGYAFADVEEARASAEGLRGPTVEEWTALAAAHALTIVGGICEAGESGALHDTAVVVDGEGLLAAYRKTHLWGREPEIFRAGNAPAPVVRTAHGPLGVAVCYDSWFPELTRSLALAGAEIIAVPMNNSAARPPHTPVQIEVTVAAATAVVNRVFVVQADRSGRERGIEFEEASVIADPDGRILAGPERGVALLVADLELERARSKAIGPRNDVFADRRPELYGGGVSSMRTIPRELP